jgi:hypothetical protein
MKSILQKILSVLVVLLLAAGCGNPWIRELFKGSASQTEQESSQALPLILRINAGADTKFIIPTNNGWEYDWYIDWGDGTPEVHKTGTGVVGDGIEHTFSTAAEYDITIRAASDTGHAAFGFSNSYSSGPNIPANRQKVLKALGHIKENTSVAEFPGAWAGCFHGCTNLNEVSATLLPEVPNGTSAIFYQMFYGCSSLAELPAGFSLPEVPNGTSGIFCAMFGNCSNLVALPDGFTLPVVLKGTSSIFGEMFVNCSSLAALPAGFSLPEVPNGTSEIFRNMFSGCSSLETLPAGFTLPAVLNGTSYIFNGMFGFCSNLTADINDLIVVPIMTATQLNATNSFNMTGTFINCSSLTGSAQTAIDTGFGGATPDSDRNTFVGCTSLTDYGSIHANWK